MNYQKELDRLLENLPNHHQTLFLHSCCAPCSSYVLEYLSRYFEITVFYYNPNISQQKEYEKRVAEQKKLITVMNADLQEGRNQILFEEGTYEPQEFYRVVKGLEQCKEGGERCKACFHLRLRKTADKAKEAGADYFATTLTISPLKNAEVLNQIGQQIAQQTIEADKPVFLTSDFKKKNGYKRSIELSKEYDLYRQDYCGCIFSKQQREAEKEQCQEKEQEVHKVK